MNNFKIVLASFITLSILISSCGDTEELINNVDVDKCEATVTINGNKITERFLPATYDSNFNPVTPGKILGISIIDLAFNNFSLVIEIPEGMLLEEKRYVFDAATCNLNQDICASVFVLGVGITSQPETTILDITFTELDLTDGGCVKGYFSGSYLEEDTGDLIEFSDGQFFKFVNDDNDQC